MNDILRSIDTAAYNGSIPQELRRNDKVLYRLYFRYMSILYKGFSAGMDKEFLRNSKEDFLKDLKLCELYMKGAFKTIREQNKLNAALLNCGKNADNCIFCKAVSGIIGAVPDADEPDIPYP